MRTPLVPALFLSLGAQGKGKPEPVEPGKVVGRRAENGMTYALRIPKSYDAKRGARALLVLHGSNMSGRAYLETIAAAGWFPDDVLIGPDGRNPGSAEGAHNFDEGSAKGVVEVIDEVAKEWKVAKAFVGGHSQGGFLTWDVFVNHPDRFAGAFPMSGGLWLRSEPERFEREGAKARAQREVAIAVIHGRADPVVRFAQSMDAVLVFLQAGFRKLRLFAPERLGHEFALSPLPEAVDWLEAMTTEEGAVALRAAREAREAGRWGDASLLAARAEKGTKDEAVRRQAKEIAAASEKAAAEGAKKVGPRIPAARDDSWVADFHAFRETFRGTKAAEPAFAAYDDLWKRHRGRAESLFAEARAAFERGEEAKAREAYRKIVAEAYASRAYFWAKDYLEGNPEQEGR